MYSSACGACVDIRACVHVHVQCMRALPCPRLIYVARHSNRVAHYACAHQESIVPTQYLRPHEQQRERALERGLLGGHRGTTRGGGDARHPLLRLSTCSWRARGQIVTASKLLCYH